MSDPDRPSIPHSVWLENTFRNNEAERMAKYRQEKRARTISREELASLTRDLFGVTRRVLISTNAEYNRQFVNEKLNEQADLQRSKWNYDFVREKPVPRQGVLIWKKVDDKPKRKAATEANRKLLKQGMKGFITIKKCGEPIQKKRHFMLESIENLEDMDMDQQEQKKQKPM